jgi:hypothetical protein
MDPPVSGFQDKAVSFVENEVLPDISNTFQHYHDIRALPWEECNVRVRNLRFLRRNADGEIEVVNDALGNDQLIFDFHLQDVEGWVNWEEVIAQFSLKTDCHHLDVPYVLKWESSGSLGRLKADERFDEDRSYIRKRVGAREAMRFGLEVMLHDYVPTDIELLTANTDYAMFFKRVFEDEAETLSNLRHAEEW